MLIAFVIAAVVVAAGIVSFRIAYPVIHVRYRLTVEVKDGDQIRSGSGVIEVSYAIQPDALATAGGFNSFSNVEGSAITVDLGEKGLLFLTFWDTNPTPAQRAERHRQTSCPYDDIGCLVFAAYNKPGTVIGPAYSQVKAELYDVLRQSGPRDVPFVTLPKLVRFLDINDPQTEAPVSPYDLAASFGPSVVLKRVVLELSTEPITPPPEIWPQWLKEKGSRSLGVPHKLSKG